MSENKAPPPPPPKEVDNTFWVVWNDRGMAPPKKKYLNHREALKAARNVAKKAGGGCVVYVLESNCGFQQQAKEMCMWKFPIYGKSLEHQRYPTITKFSQTTLEKEQTMKNDPTLSDIVQAAIDKNQGAQKPAAESAVFALKLTPDPVPDNPASIVHFVKTLYDAVKVRNPSLRITLAEAKRLAEYLDENLVRDNNGVLYLKTL